MDRINLSNHDQVKEGQVVIGLGNFDGMHLGHQGLIHTIVREARTQNRIPALLLFCGHTEETLSGKKREYLMSLEDKLTFAEQAGIERVYLQTFDQNFLSMSPKDFIHDYLLSKLQVVEVVVGKDYRFGKGAKGDVSYLRQESKGGELFELCIAEDVTYKGEKISSTRIRKALSCGEMGEAEKMLGRFYSIRGRVVPGFKRGRTLGFPTANMDLDFRYLLPREGVYLTRTHLDGQPIFGMTSIGTNPTFTEEVSVKIETYFFDIDQDLYGRELELEFLFFERGNIKFDQVEDLIAQMQEDEKILRKQILVYKA